MTYDAIGCQASRGWKSGIQDRCFWCDELLLKGDVVIVAKRSGNIESCSGCAIDMGTIMLARGYSLKHQMTFTPSGLDIL